jgi:hypothetical protein
LRPGGEIKRTPPPRHDTGRSSQKIKKGGGHSDKFGWPERFGDPVYVLVRHHAGEKFGTRKALV